MIILPSLLGSFFLGFSSLSPRGAVNSVTWLFYAGWAALGDSGVRERDPRLIAALGVKSNLLQEPAAAGPRVHLEPRGACLRPAAAERLSAAPTAAHHAP